MRDLYRLEMENFRDPLIVVFYVLSMVVVGLHLWHGAVERVPVARPRPSALRRRCIRGAGLAVAVVIAGGFIVIPVGHLLAEARP